MSYMSPSIGFINHAELAFNREANALYADQIYDRNSIKPNLIEKIGDVLCWHVTELPAKINKAFNDPRVVTVAMTALAMLAVTFAFYPTATWLALKAGVTFIVEKLPWEVVKASVYALTMLAVVGVGTRALGRFSNDELMSHFYFSYRMELNAQGSLIEVLPVNRQWAPKAS